jgi:antitoxin component of RelBE/YafQ-DinJ toxin-antitoxin module
MNSFMNDGNDCRQYVGRSYVPNKETRQSIENIEKGKNIVRAKDIKDLFRKLGI